MGRFAYAGGRPLYRVYAPRREYAFMEENGPVDHGRLRRKRCERGASFDPPWRPHECSWRIIVPPRPIPLHHSLVKGAATNTLHWWSGELTANYLAMQVALDFNTERKAGVAFFIVF